MDRANLALAEYLACRENEVHVVAHRVDSQLLERPNVFFHGVPKPANSDFLGEPFLASVGKRWAKKIQARNGKVIVNGGNCNIAAVNWVHYVHAAYKPTAYGLVGSFWKNWKHRTYLRQEKEAICKADLVIANSDRTRQDLINHLGISNDKIHTLYLSVETQKFYPASEDERTETRERLGWEEDRTYVAFIGSPHDHRKGFDVVFDAWCRDADEKTQLVVMGRTSNSCSWKKRVQSSGLEKRIQFLGLVKNIHEILRACDAVVAPTRYESYGLGVHEALCCGVPALVSQDAGVAEQYPDDLKDLLLPNPEDPEELAQRLGHWRNAKQHYRNLTRPLAARLRNYTWDKMSERFIDVVETRALI